MITYQDYEKAVAENRLLKWLGASIINYRNSNEYREAERQEQYILGRNPDIMNALRVIYSSTGVPLTDFTAANHRIASRKAHRFVSQRCTYSLGNGISFTDHLTEKRSPDGTVKTIDETKEALGQDFDRSLYKLAYWGTANDEAYIFVHKGHDADTLEYNVFKKTEFLALKDENTGALRGGIRFWSLDWRKRPVTAALYTEEGVTKYRTREGKYGVMDMEETEPLTPYIQQVSELGNGELEIVGEVPVSTIPIFVFSSNDHHVSALENVIPAIYATDMVLSGFANDIDDCAQIYWAVSGAMGMGPDDLDKARDQFKFLHMMQVDGDHSSVTPVTVEPPYQSRESCLKMLNQKLYDDFGALDLHTIQAGQTNDHIDAAYQCMDEEADDFEYQLTGVIYQILDLLGIEDEPKFKRNKISNLYEQTQMVMLASNSIGREMTIKKLPFLDVDEQMIAMSAEDREQDERMEDDEEEDMGDENNV